MFFFCEELVDMPFLDDGVPLAIAPPSLPLESEPAAQTHAEYRYFAHSLAAHADSCRQMLTWVGRGGAGEVRGNERGQRLRELKRLRELEKAPGARAVERNGARERVGQGAGQIY